jgi:hypothetical protein
MYGLFIIGEKKKEKKNPGAELGTERTWMPS